MKRLLSNAVGAVSLGACVLACSAAEEQPPTSDAASSGHAASGGAGAGGNGGSAGIGGFNPGCPDTSNVCQRCSSDLHTVLDCDGNVVETCPDDQGCDLKTGSCVNACAAAGANESSLGCEYYATFMDQVKFGPSKTDDGCFAVFVANTWTGPAHLSVEYDGGVLPINEFARIPSGAGATITYAPFDSAAGLPPGEVAILFLSGPTGVATDFQAPCPVATPVPNGAMLTGSGFAKSFRITADVPIVAYQMNPYGGGGAATTGASLLLPTSAWAKEYLAVNAYSHNTAFNQPASLNVVAMLDDTEVVLHPVASLKGGGGIPSGPANVPVTLKLDRGQHVQLSEKNELTGSVIQSDKPVGLMGGHRCMNIPADAVPCDHGEQMIPPVRALGSEYVGVMYRPRAGEPAIWRVIGAVDGTELTWSADVGGPAKLDRGQIVEFATEAPFVVKSQDACHPFVLITYMSSSYWLSQLNGIGDPDMVLSVPPQQYRTSYVFFTDPSYPETNLVVVRAKKKGQFHDVVLDCAGALDGWEAIGDYEWTRADLTTGNFQAVGACSTGRREMTSEAPFGLWVWGWGSPATGRGGGDGIRTRDVSYGYPAGMSLQAINKVVLAPK
jgi:hypothetical protein